MSHRANRAQLLSFRSSNFLMGAACGGSAADEKLYKNVGLQKNHVRLHTYQAVSELSNRL